MNYRNLTQASFTLGDYQLVPIRFEDREHIRVWRNEQMYHLRQKELLSKEQQDRYFTDVVAPLFEKDFPTQYLFSYLFQGNCIGYGGLVHINYEKKSAELSFIMNTALEKEAFSFHWSNFLHLIELIAFHDLKFNRIFTYAYDLRPQLYPILESCGFMLERKIPNALVENGPSVGAIIHSKWNASLRKAVVEDMNQTFTWATDENVRKYAFSSDKISLEMHKPWFEKKIQDGHCMYFLLETPLHPPLGSLRIDINEEEKTGLISYLIDPKYHGQGWGIALLVMGQHEAKKRGIHRLIGEVMPENSSSCAIFAKLGYDAEELSDRIRYIKIL